MPITDDLKTDNPNNNINMVKLRACLKMVIKNYYLLGS